MYDLNKRLKERSADKTVSGVRLTLVTFFHLSVTGAYCVDENSVQNSNSDVCDELIYMQL